MRRLVSWLILILAWLAACLSACAWLSQFRAVAGAAGA